MRIEIENVQALKDSLTNMGLNFDVIAGDAVLEVATEISTSVKNAIAKGSPAGRQYKRGKRAVHTASAPGQAPASDTGRLVGSIYTTETGRLEATVGSPLAYAYYLEHGTRRMAARPVWLRKSKEKARLLPKAIEAGIKRAIR